MKKAKKWVLLVLGIPAIAVAILWVDSYYRAVAAIRAEDERLAKDITEFRARKKPGLPIDRERFMARLPGDTSGEEKRHRRLPCPMSLFMGTMRAQVDQGHSGHTAFYYALLQLYFIQEPTSIWSYSQPPLTGDQAIDALSVTHHLAQECGYDSASLLHISEIQALDMLKGTLADRPSAAELRRLGERLDRCLPSRPTFADAFDAEHLMDRAEVLRVLHLKADPSGFIARKPGWREFFSWRILLVKCLNELDEDYSGRPEERSRDRRTTGALRAEKEVREQSDREALCHWTLARTAVAIALFRAERGRDLERLDQLVPDFLPRSPEGVTLLDAVLRVSLTSEQVVTWDLRNR